MSDDNNPEKGLVKGLVKGESNDSGKTYQVKVGNATIDVRELTTDEIKDREWKKFDEKYSRKIMVVVNSLKQHNLTCLALSGSVGVYDQYKGNWDAFIPDSNFTVPKILEKKREEEDLNPLKYFIGIDDSVPDETVEKLRKKLLRYKLLY